MQSLTPPPIDIATLTINDIYCYDFGEWQVQKNDDDQKIWVRVRWEQPISKAVDIIVHSLAMKKKANNKKIILDNVLIKEEYMDTTTVMKKQMVSTKFITDEKMILDSIVAPFSKKKMVSTKFITKEKMIMDSIVAPIEKKKIQLILKKQCLDK